MKSLTAALFLLLNLYTFAMAGTIKISLPDGQPAAHAQLEVLVDSQYEYSFTADESGGFLFPTNDFGMAEIKLKNSNGENYIPVVLPAQIITSGDLSLVMQSALKR